MIFNGRYSVWNEEFQVDYLNRIDTLKKSFFIPYVSVAEAEIISDLCCGYVNNIVDGNHLLFIKNHKNKIIIINTEILFIFFSNKIK